MSTKEVAALQGQLAEFARQMEAKEKDRETPTAAALPAVLAATIFLDEALQLSYLPVGL